MNIKAERIEQLIQIINRNLQLVCANNVESLTPLELRKLRKVDTSAFGHDKFAFEMVHFIKSAEETVKGKSNQIADKLFTVIPSL